MPDKKTRVKLITPLGRLSFPAVFNKARPMPDSTSAPKYEATILFDKLYLKANKDELARFEAIKREVDVVCLEKFKKGLKDSAAKIPRFWNPFRDGAEKDHLNGYGAGVIFFKSSGNRRPGVVGPDGKTPIDDENAIYSGCYVRLSITPYAFDNKMKGVGLGLNNLMFIKDGERMDGSSDPSEDFGEYSMEPEGGDSESDDLL